MFDWDEMIPKPRSAEELLQEYERRKKIVKEMLEHDRIAKNER